MGQYSSLSSFSSVSLSHTYDSNDPFREIKYENYLRKVLWSFLLYTNSSFISLLCRFGLQHLQLVKEKKISTAPGWEVPVLEV